MPQVAKSSAAKPSSASEFFNEICTLRIELRHTDPLIWRELDIPTSVTLLVLHDIVQIAMGWCYCHLWEFTILGQKYGIPMEDDWGMPPPAPADKIRLRDVLRKGRARIDIFTTWAIVGSTGLPSATSGRAI